MVSILDIALFNFAFLFIYTDRINKVAKVPGTHGYVLIILLVCSSH